MNYYFIRIEPKKLHQGLVPSVLIIDPHSHRAQKMFVHALLQVLN